MKPANHVSRRSFLRAGALGVTGLAAGGTRVAWAQGDAKRGGTLVVRSGPLRGIDPHLETWAAALQVIHQTYNALLKFNHDGTKILPDLAESWEQKDDLTYSFRLRQGVKFHNGDEVTSEDVKFSIMRNIGKRSTTGYAGPLRTLIADIETPAPDRVVIVSKESTLIIPTYLSRSLST